MMNQYTIVCQFCGVQLAIILAENEPNGMTCSACFVPEIVEETERKIETLNELLRNNPQALDIMINALTGGQ